MAITIADIQADVNSYIDDATTNTVTAAERLARITEATSILAQRLSNDLMRVEYDFDYLDTVYSYKITSSVPYLQQPSELRFKDITQQGFEFTRKDPREIVGEIGRGESDPSYGIDYRNANYYLMLNFSGRRSATDISSFDATTSGGGTWAVDAVNSDATNITIDTAEFLQGTGSLNFDVDVSQSANNRATIINSTITSKDLSTLTDIGSFVFDAYIPDVTNYSSFTLYWGSDSSNYYSATVTADIDNASFSNGWNTIKVNWADATKTSSPDDTAIAYYRIDFNYTGSQADDTDFRLDDFRVMHPERMKFIYNSWKVGADNSSTELTAFAATTDVPFFSGTYDQFRYYVAHKAAEYLLRQMGQHEQANFERAEADTQMKSIQNLFPKSTQPETRSFKVHGVNFNRRGRRSR